MKYWVRIGKESLGPVNPEQFRKINGITEDSLVCPEGGTSASDWRRLRDVPALLRALGTPPAQPPLPKVLPASSPGLLAPQDSPAVESQAVLSESEMSWKPWFIIGAVVLSFVGVIMAGSPRQAEVPRDSVVPKNTTAVMPQTQGTSPDREPALNIERLKPFPEFALDKVRLSFATGVKSNRNYTRDSGYFAGLESQVYTGENNFPRFEIIGREGRVYAYEVAYDINEVKLWTEIPVPNMGPVPMLVITSLLDVQNLSGFNGARDMSKTMLLTYTVTVRAILDKAKAGEPERVSVDSTTLVFSRNKGELRVLYVPTATWEMMRLGQLSGGDSPTRRASR